MRFADVFIRRPVFATMLIASLVVLGLFSYRGLGLDLFPNIDFPIVTVTTTLKGASVEEMETGVTKVIEEAVNTIDGIDELRSITKEGLSSLVVQFVLEKPRDIAAQVVRDKVAGVLAQLPVGTGSRRRACRSSRCAPPSSSRSSSCPAAASTRRAASSWCAPWGGSSAS